MNKFLSLLLAFTLTLTPITSVFPAEFTNSQKQFLGAENILINPGFEGGVGSWTLTAGSKLSEATVKTAGSRSLKATLSAQALELYQDSTLHAAQFNGQVQGIAYVRVKTTVSGIKVSARQAGATSSTLTVDVSNNGEWGLYKIPVVLGATSNGISIHSNGVTVTGDVYVDDAFVGAVSVTNDSGQVLLAGESYFPGSTSATCSRTATTMGSLVCTAAFPGPTIVESNLGQWQTTDSDLPRQTINNLPAGKYKATFLVVSHSNANSGNAMAINDGTTTCEPIRTSNLEVTSSTISCTFDYSVGGNRVFELYAGSAASTINLVNEQTAPRSSVKFILEYYGSSSTYSTTSDAYTGWESCGLEAADFAGMGTVSGIELECKRQGSDLLMQGTWTTGTVTAAEARINLEFRGETLTSTAFSAKQIAGHYTSRVIDSGTIPNIVSLFIAPSSTYITFQKHANSTQTNALGTELSTSNAIYSLRARIPISGWDNTPTIVGDFSQVKVVQTKYCETTATGTGSVAIPYDDTIPQITEGNEVLTCSITPSFSNSKLRVLGSAFVGEEANTSDYALAALFRDATANAIAADIGVGSSAAIIHERLEPFVQVDSTATTSTTFSLRVGLNTANTIRWNGANAARLLGGAIRSYIKIEEVREGQ